MATTLEYMQYIADQLREVEGLRWRKMFGEYGVYCCGKLFALVCDNQLFIKATEAGRSLAPELPLASPYEGAKPYILVEDTEDAALLARLAAVTCRELPEPKPKRPRKEK